MRGASGCASTGGELWGEQRGLRDHVIWEAEVGIRSYRNKDALERGSARETAGDRKHNAYSQCY